MATVKKLKDLGVKGLPDHLQELTNDDLKTIRQAIDKALADPTRPNPSTGLCTCCCSSS